jgi:hypothetical protein
MILPRAAAIHLRGMNSSVLRDATIDPIQRDLYPDEEFVYKVNAGTIQRPRILLDAQGQRTYRYFRMWK